MSEDTSGGSSEVRARRYAERKLAAIDVALRRLTPSEDRETRRELEIEGRALAADLEALAADDALPHALIAARCDLDAAALEVLWLAAAPWLDPSLRGALARLNENLLHDFVDPSLCLRLLGGSRSETLGLQGLFASDGALLRRGLLRLAPRDVAPNNLMLSELVPGEHVVTMLRGQPALSHALSGVARRLPLVGEVIPEGAPESDGLARLARVLRGFEAVDHLGREAVWGAHGFDLGRGLGVLLLGGEGSGRLLGLKRIAQRMGQALVVVEGGTLAQHPPGLRAARWSALMQEAALRRELVVVRHADGMVDPSSSIGAQIAQTLTEERVAVVFCVEPNARVAPALEARVIDRIIHAPSSKTAPMIEMWRGHLSADARPDHEALTSLAQRFNLTGAQMRKATRLTRLLEAGRADGEEAEPLIERLEAATMVQLDTEMGHLAETSRDARSFSDLILNDDTAGQISEIIAAINNRQRVMREWGLRESLRRGIGICCLFDGEPGTGKTLASEVITSAVGMKLLRVNVSSIVDKYIGETEKNLSRIFERARPDTTVLLFDEADALFGKRTEVSRSTDRYANMEINVLLQLIERYEGVTLLTTNLKQSIDAAFERRITFKVNFSMPEEAQRMAIWERLLPPQLPMEDDVDFDILAEMELSGGEIKNAIIRAAYAAARKGTGMDMAHLFDAARREASAAGRLVREIRDPIDF